MVEVRAELAGLDEAERRVVILRSALRDLRPFWPRLVPVFVRWMREQFESEGAWGGETWAPLSPAYAARKARRYPGKRILVATGDLRKAASTPRRLVTASTLTLIIDDSKMAHGYGDARSVRSHRRVRGTPTRPERAVAPFHQFGGGSAEVAQIARQSIEGRPPRRRIVPDVLPADAVTEVAALANDYVRELAARLGL